MKRFSALAAIAAGFLTASAAGASAKLRVAVDTDSQTMHVYVDGKLRHEWRVSTGRRGHETPSGKFRPQRLEKEWYSRKYDDAPMPNAIFFNGGYAIHGTNQTRNLGRAASHGCVRLGPSHAAQLFSLVQAHKGQARITIDD